MDLFDLVAKITLDSSEAENGVSSFGDKLKNGLGTAAKVGGAAIAAVTTATVAMTSAFIKGAADVAEYGDNIDKMSQKMGISAEAYQEWDAIMQHSGASIDSMQRGMTTLSKAVEGGSDAFSKLGLSQEEVASMNQEELFAATIAGLQRMEAGTERTVLAQELLGGSAKELGALLNMSAEETEAMRQRVHELGGVMSDEAVKASARFQDSLQDMQTSFSGLKRNMLVEFMPSISTVMDGLTEIFSGDSNTGLPLISSGINDLVTNISEQIPKFLEVGSGIILALTGAIAENLPQLLLAGADALLTITNGIIAQLPMIIKTGLEVLTTLARGIGSNLKTIIPAVVSVILQIIETLTSPESISSLIDGAIELILGLSEGFIQAIPQIIEALPVIIQNVTTALIGAIPQLVSAGYQLFVALVQSLPSIIGNILSAVGQILNSIFSEIGGGVNRMLEAGKNLIVGLWNGIVGAADWLWQQISGWLNNLWGGILGFFGIHSPSTEMAWVGEMLVAGLTNSIEDNGEDAVDAAEQMSDDVLSAMSKLSGNEFGADMNINRNVVDSFSGMKGTVERESQVSENRQGIFGEDGIINIVVQSILDGEIIGETAYRYQMDKVRAMG